MRTVALVVLALALVATYLTWTASRMDRLHARTDAARAALDAQLVRRAAAALELAAEVRDEPLAQAARSAAHMQPEDWPARAPVESDLSARLRALADGGARLPADLAACCARAALTRRFYNDAVRDTLAFRRRRVVRGLRLAGHAPAPEPVDIDDTPPISDLAGSAPTVT